MLQDLLGAVTLGSIYLMFALGMSLAWGSIGILNFAHGSIFMFAAFVGYLVLAQSPLSLTALVALGVTVGALLSVLVHVVAFEQITRWTKDHRTAEMQILIGGIGIAGIPLALAQYETRSNPFGFTQSSFQPTVHVVGDLRVSDLQVLIVVAAAVLTTAIALWLRHSRQGLALRSIGVDAEVASMMGVNRRRFAIVTMAVAGGLAGLAAVLYTFYVGALTPESGETLIIKAFACIILGGVGSMAGVAVGAFALAFAETLVLTNFGGLWVDAISFSLIFAVLLLRPAGLFGKKAVRRT